LIGYVGRMSFRDDLPPAAEQFPIDRRQVADLKTYAGFGGAGHDQGPRRWPQTAGYSADAIHLLASGHLYEVDVKARTVRDAWPDGDLVSLGVAQEYSANGRATERQRSWLALRTRQRIEFQGAQPGDDRSFVLPEELRDLPVLNVYMAADGTLFVDPGRAYSAQGVQVRLCRFDAAGNVVERHTVELSDGMVLFDRRLDPYLVSSMFPGILPGAAWAVLWALEHPGLDGRPSTVAATLRRAFDATGPASSLQVALSVILAWLCRRRQMRYAQRGTLVWMAFVFLFGVPGWLGYLWHRRWPALASCPSCGRAAPRDREVCARCREEFPRPSVTGMEVFA
jgi:hypothetical protein